MDGWGGADSAGAGAGSEGGEGGRDGPIDNGDRDDGDQGWVNAGARLPPTTLAKSRDMAAQSARGGKQRADGGARTEKGGQHTGVGARGAASRGAAKQNGNHGASAELNEEQLSAAHHPARAPLMILAGAGSGKTKTLISRIEFLTTQGIPLDKILVLTFSTAATKELSQRVAKAFPGPSKDRAITVSTFHSYGLKICREFASAIGLPEDFVIFSGGRQRKVVTAGLLLYKKHAKAGEHEAPASGVGRGGNGGGGGGGDGAGREMEGHVDKHSVRRVCQALTQALALGSDEESMSEELAFVYKYYKETLRECKALDFSSFIGEAARLLRTHEPAKEHFCTLFSHVLVDEFQDTSKAQFNLVTSLAPHGGVTVVGDDDQTIFGFNGSNHENFNLFRSHYPAFTELRLQQNYRSSGVIVEAARAVIQHNKMRCSKDPKAVAPPGEKIRVVECRNDTCEVRYVVEQIKKMRSEGIKLKHVAVLYRTQRTGKQFQTELRRQEIPFNVHGVSFWRRKIVKNIVAVLRLVKNRADDQAFRRLLKAFMHKEGKDCAKTVLEHLEKVARARKSCLWLEGKSCLQAKVSGALSKKHMVAGGRMMSTVEHFVDLARNHPCMTQFVDTVLTRMPEPHKYEVSVSSEEGATLLNQGKDTRTVREVVMHYVSTFEAHWKEDEALRGDVGPGAGERGAAGAVPGNATCDKRGLPREAKSECERGIGAFLDYQVVEEAESNRKIKEDNDNAVTISTIHHSKGLEWDHVFLVRFNAGEMPLCNNVNAEVDGMTLEEERRLCYVAMTRAKHSLCLCHVATMQQLVLSPSPFLKEIPAHLLVRDSAYSAGPRREGGQPAAEGEDEMPEEVEEVCADGFMSCGFLTRFDVAQRGSVSQLFHKWAKTVSYKEPAALIGKVKAVVAEKLAAKATNNKALLRQLLPMLQEPHVPGEGIPTACAMRYAHEVIAFEAAPEHVREQYKAARARHFANSNGRAGMEGKPPTTKQLNFLKSLGCPVQPKTMMECSALIDKYKAM